MDPFIIIIVLALATKYAGVDAMYALRGKPNPHHAERASVKTARAQSRATRAQLRAEKSQARLKRAREARQRRASRAERRAAGPLGALRAYRDVVIEDAIESAFQKHQIRHARRIEKRDLRAAERAQQPEKPRPARTFFAGVRRNAGQWWEAKWTEAERKRQAGEFKLRPNRDHDIVQGDVVPNATDTPDKPVTEPVGEQAPASTDDPKPEPKPEPVTEPSEQPGDQSGEPLSDAELRKDIDLHLDYVPTPSPYPPTESIRHGVDLDAHDETSAGPVLGSDFHQSTTAERNPEMSEAPAEVYGLRSAIDNSEETAENADNASTGIEHAIAALEVGGTSGPALSFLHSAKEDFDSAATNLRSAAAELKQHLTVRDAYAGTNDEAGEKDFVTAD